MFEVRCIIGDKKLADALRALRHHTIEPPVVIPIDDPVAPPPLQAPTPQTAPKKFIRLKPKRGGAQFRGKGVTQIIRDLIARSGATMISAKEMREATMDAGYTRNGYSGAIRVLTEDKDIRKIGFGQYEVLKPTKRA